MADIALRGMSPQLHKALRDSAERNHRSLNGEILARLEDSMGIKTVDVDTLLARIEARKDRSSVRKLSEKKLRKLREQGRS